MTVGDTHTNPAVSVLVPSYNRKPFLKLAIDSIRQELEEFEPGYEIIAADGGSDDGSVQWLCKQKDIILILQHNHGQWQGKPVVRRNSGYYINLLLKCAKGKYVCWMTDDAIIVPGAILNAYSYFEERLKTGERLGALAFYNNDWPIKKKYLGDITLNGIPIAHYGLFLRQALEEVGYYDEDYYFYSVDDDMSCKLWQKGWKVESYKAFICHCAHANLGARISNTEKALEDKKRFYFKWNGLLFDANEDVRNDWKEVEISDDTNVGRKFAVPYYFSLAQQFLVALARFDRKFLASVKRGLLRYLKTGRWVTQ